MGNTVKRMTNTPSSTRLSRRAIADFVDSNLPRFNKWLAKVADGIPKVDTAGNILRDPEGSVVYLVKPDPLAAIKVVADITEYHLPKLSRQDVQLTGVVANMDVDSLTAADLAQLSLADLKQLALQQFSQRGDTIDVEPVVVPSWLDPAGNASD